MTDSNRPSIHEMTEGNPSEKPQRDRRAWVGFVESDVVNFMQSNDIEKMTLDDGSGNKAKLTKRKDGSIFAESTSSNIL